MYRAIGPPTVQDKAFADWVERELAAIELAFVDFDFLQLKELNAVPVRPRAGMVVFADGTNWNPGSGIGFYGYHSGAWNKLG